MSLAAQAYVEQLLTDSLHLLMYYGSVVDASLCRVIELLPTPTPEAPMAFIQRWRDYLDAAEVYRRSEVQNNLLDLWSLLAATNEIMVTDIPVLIATPT